MYDHCPKCKYQRQISDTATVGVCPACGLIFAKGMQHQFAVTATGKTDSISGAESGLTRIPVEWLLYVEPETGYHLLPASGH